MARILAPVVGVFFIVGVLWSFALGVYSARTQPPGKTAESVFHLAPKQLHLASDGAFGHFDRRQLRRGFQIYTEICSNCHALHFVAFRDLEAIGYSAKDVQAIAAKVKVPDYNPATGEMKSRDGLPTDYFPPVAYPGQGSPPDLSLITKARHGGAAYVYSILTGFQDQPAALPQRFPDAKTPAGMYYNPYFANLNIAMPPPLMADGQVTYQDGTKATVNQMAQDIAAFLVWTAEPKLEARHQTGWVVIGFLLFAMVLTYMSYRRIWANTPH